MLAWCYVSGVMHAFGVKFLFSCLVVGPLLVTASVAQQPPSLIVVPPTGFAAAGPQGGPFSPLSFEYQLSTSGGSIRYSVSTPSWLIANARSGTIDHNGVTIIFTINPAAARLRPGTYGSTAVSFRNITNGVGTTARMATLTVLATSNQPSYRSGTANGGRLRDNSGELLTDGRGEPLLAR